MSNTLLWFQALACLTLFLNITVCVIQFSMVKYFRCRFCRQLLNYNISLKKKSITFLQKSYFNQYLKRPLKRLPK